MNERAADEIATGGTDTMIHGFRHAALAAAATLALLAPTIGAAQEKKAGASLVMTTGTPTGSWFPTGAAIAELTNASFSDNPVDVIVGAGAVGNIMHLAAGKSDMGLSYGAFLKLASEGGNAVNPGAPIPQLRSVMALIPYVLHIIVGEGTDHGDFANLAADKPKLNIGTGVTGATEHFGLELVLQEYGVSLKDLESWGGSVTQTQTAGRSDGWKNRQFDWVSFMGTVPATNYFELLTVRPSKLVSVSNEVRDRLVSQYGFAQYDVPAGTYPNQDKDWAALGFPMVLFVTADVSDDIVYEMTKNVAENKERMMKATAAFESWQPERMVDALGVELHPGAAKYYRERGWLK
jgi:TRAP transporter TAXI family solute receptor